jgi:CBS domain-containing protein
MKTIKYILEIKGREIWSIDPNATMYDALALMAEKNVGALLVIEEGKLVGVISERDYARKVILKDRKSKETPVQSIMSSEVVYIRDDQTVEAGLVMMTAKHIRHLPVFADDHLIGIVSIGDLVNAIIASQKDLIKQLENYILEYTSIT